jgi:2-dehydropantoate 2-reductase
VVGPGALGCLHAALLHRAGIEISLLDHRADRATAINARGLMVEGDAESWSAPVRCAADPADLPATDIVLFCVKTFQTADAARHAAPLVGRETVLVRLQNGLADPQPLVSLAGPARVVLATSGLGAHLAAWGRVQWAGTGPTRLGPVALAGLAAAAAVADLLGRALPGPVELHADIGPWLWRKLIVNAVINPLTALTGLRNGELLGVPLLRAAMADLAAEAEAVGRALGYDLRPGEGLELAEQACRETARNRSSMLQDVQAGRRTEIEDISGAVVREARRLNLAAPVTSAIVALLAEVAAGEPTKHRPP